MYWNNVRPCPLARMQRLPRRALVGTTKQPLPHHFENAVVLKDARGTEKRAMRVCNSPHLDNIIPPPDLSVRTRWPQGLRNHFRPHRVDRDINYLRTS